MPDETSVRDASAESRIEKDLLGEKEVPARAYCGIQTARALENFHITGVPICQHDDLIRAFAMVKIAAARANHECGVLSAEVLDAIEKAGRELIRGELHGEFRIDVLQGGAGTSTNMNVNEVIANRALELMGYRKGEYVHCDPHDHVNSSQSTNDSYPTALHIAILLGNEKLLRELRRLTAALRAKGEAFGDILKMGRTQLQDAVPMTLGQEFNAWGESLDGEIAALESVEESLLEVNMGGTAIGTGLNAPAGYAERCVLHLAEVSDLAVTLAGDLVEATQDTQGFVIYSSALKSLAIKMSKICNDLRLLSSGPRAGFNEINLPARQPGSSIMPGKVNPV
ncbi:MAG: aspartate ammonia-lyase, partial [Acidobacteriota bacterium]